jgi:predicted SnoaL-like aldol condensation-catalyzing enzyme
MPATSGSKVRTTDAEDTPMTKLALLLAAALPLIAAAPASAQAPACTLTPAQVDANTKFALGFFKPGVTAAERLAMVDASYIQHNPRFKKYATDNKLSDYDGFKAMLGQLAGGAPPAGVPAGPRPPAGDPLAVVMTQCDLVTAVHKNFRQDPTAAPGTWYEVFTFDTFRVKNGKLVEHWDDAEIPPPPPPKPAG